MGSARPKFSAPTVVNLELTDVCNEKCRHCYNHWREENARTFTLENGKFERLLDEFLEVGIFHVVLTGGEPMANFELLEHALKRLIDNSISVSCNSNLTLATDERINRLKDIGLDHILTSLCSYAPVTNDYMTNKIGYFDRIVKGIENAVKNGIRVSVNMVVSEKNRDHVYETAKFVHGLGCQRIFGTRAVPSVNLSKATGSEYDVSKKDAMHIVNQLLKAKAETGIMIGTLVSYPLCLLGDLEKFRDFVGRGCPAQSGHLINIGANGETHACAHEGRDYGNVFNEGILSSYRNMKQWHDGSYIHSECMSCDYSDICRSGCRMSALGFYGDLTARDNLMQDKHKFIKHYKIVYDNEIYDLIHNGLEFVVPKRLRFRKEDGYYLLNIRWANTIIVTTYVAEYLLRMQKNGRKFTIRDFGSENREMLAKLYFKDVVETIDSVKYDEISSRVGLGLDMLVG